VPLPRAACGIPAGRVAIMAIRGDRDLPFYLLYTLQAGMRYCHEATSRLSLFVFDSRILSPMIIISSTSSSRRAACPHHPMGMGHGISEASST